MSFKAGFWSWRTDETHRLVYEATDDQVYFGPVWVGMTHFFAYAEDGVALTQLAAAYAFGIACNHPFVDGNKQTAFVASLLFLRLNGYVITASSEAKYETFLALADGSLSGAALQSWLERYCQPA